MILLVDTNVPLTANRTDGGEGQTCVESCIDWMEAIRAGEHTIVLDEDGEILDEYFHKLEPFNRQPGYGDRFLKWIIDHQWDQSACHRVKINRRQTDDPNAPLQYEEFPMVPGLEKFDIADRKFIAAACAHPERPEILEATDAKWWGWSTALESGGVRIRFICEDLVRGLFEKNYGGPKPAKTLGRRG